MKQPLLFDVGSQFTNRSTKSVTFAGKMELPIHRWYRLTASFSPKLAHDIAEHFSLNDEDYVLDPFSGVGTVPLCLKYRGVPACSVELNPYLHFVSTVKTRTYSDVDSIQWTLRKFSAEFEKALEDVPYLCDPAAYLRENQHFIPPINFPDRWWSPGNLAQLVCLRMVVAEFRCEPLHLDLLKMAVLGILIPVSNAKHNHVSLTFAKNPLPVVSVSSLLAQQIQIVVEDLQRMRQKTSADVEIYRGNSKHLSQVLPNNRPISAVITSPPYPNRFSYARETRPHLFFFDFIDNATAVGQLETDAIGGTWGKATSTLSNGIAPDNKLIEKLLAPYIGNINTDGSLMANYITKYFNNIYAHASEISRVCRQDARLAYVIGNSKFYGHPLPSDEILAAIFDQFEFRLVSIDKMRKRQSKSGLYEAVVFMTRT